MWRLRERILFAIRTDQPTDASDRRDPSRDPGQGARVQSMVEIEGLEFIGT